ncbi:uncharacterized protein LAESUDRAFT_763628 [Laetiporus sulphureus 93-53]|uniref:Uncharacterized protein n=1 Tax=Laetiporus sulphureus 93-53 TaxID=1314785 RepID=A0A165BQZ2_9APHY|nr:uncharacterized protein LAESUDRAFT_763628 [Laetiporus sulphureus 93-53]KZT01495.1 hypothetical protein LAESUDRAFT_763628 [Laetiporus sulphureus 93-53]
MDASARRPSNERDSKNDQRPGDSHMLYDAQTSSAVPPMSEKAARFAAQVGREGVYRHEYVRPSFPENNLNTEHRSPALQAFWIANTHRYLCPCPSLASPVIQSSGSSSPLVAYARREPSQPSGLATRRACTSLSDVYCLSLLGRRVLIPAVRPPAIGVQAYIHR